VEPERIEHTAALGAVERAVGRPALVLQHLQRVDVGGECFAALAAKVGFGHRLLGEHAGAAKVQRPQRSLRSLVGVGVEPARQLHHVTVGVEHGESIDVCHRQAPFICSPRAARSDATHGNGPRHRRPRRKPVRRFRLAATTAPSILRHMTTLALIRRMRTGS
jgi:hypothetical protein